jgi:hypothetical protein
MTRLQKIARLEAQLNDLGRFIVLAIDRLDVKENVAGVSRCKVAILDAIAADAAMDLSSNEMDTVGVTDALVYAAKEYDE